MSLRNVICSALLFFSLAIFASNSRTSLASEPGKLVEYRGTVYLITYTQEGGKGLLGFPGEDELFSWGYSFKDVVKADAEDVSLINSTASVSPFGFLDGSLITMDNGEDKTVYIVYGGCKYAFTSGEQFLSLGYSFSHVRKVSSDSIARACSRIGQYSMVSTVPGLHPSGSLVVDKFGTVYWLTESGIVSFPTAEVFLSYGLDFDQVVPMSPEDQSKYAAQGYGLVKHRDLRFVQ